MEFLPPTTIYDFYLEWHGLGIGIQGYFLMALQILQWMLVKFASAARPGASAWLFALTLNHSVWDASQSCRNMTRLLPHLWSRIKDLWLALKSGA